MIPARACRSRPLAVTGPVIMQSFPAPGYSGCGRQDIGRTSYGAHRAGPGTVAGEPSRKGMRMLTRRAAVWAAVSGLVGTCMIGISFAINPGPPAGASGAQITAFGQQHHDAILWGAWLQAVGPVLIAVFALAIVFLAGATTRLAGWMTLFGTAALMTVSLIEITGYIGTLQTSPATMGLTSLALIYSVQHLY